MKRLFALFALCLTLVQAYSQNASHRWTLTALPDSDATACAADQNWTKDSKNRWCYTPAMTAETLMANGKEVGLTSGLHFTITANSSGNLRLGGKTASLWLGDQCSFIIPNRTAGETFTVEYMTSKSSASRTPTVANVSGTFAATSGKSHSTGTGTVDADGDISFTVEGGMYIYSIYVGTDQGGGTDTGDSGNPNNPTDSVRGLDYTPLETIRTPPAGTAQTIYCSPDGDDTTADGTEAKPYFDMQLAVNRALPGTTILMKAGRYVYSKRININDRNGTHDQYITLMCPNGRAVLDFSAMPYHAHSDNPLQGVRLTSSYWHFYCIDICNASDNGLLIERNKPEGGSSSDILTRTQDAHDNIIEFCNFYRNGDTGLQIKNLGAWNYILNCDSYYNCDTDNGDADGFAPKISVGDGNYLFGCRAYQNSDDGYDVFIKKDGGFTDNKTIVMENCLAYENGTLVDSVGNVTSSEGNANGFKLGSNQGLMNVVMNRCLAVRNGAKGFDQNHNAGDIIMNNCTGFTNSDINYGKDGSKGSYSYKIYEDARTARLTNCIAINQNFVQGKDMGKPGKTADTNYGGIYLGEDVELVTSNMRVADTWMEDVATPTELLAPRLSDGSLPWDGIKFLHINTTTGAELIDTGTKVSQQTEPNSEENVPIPAINYTGSAPDLGAFEVGMAQKTVSYGTLDGISYAKASGEKRVSLRQAFNGMVLVGVNGATATDKFTIAVYSQGGQLLGQHPFYGTATSIYLPKMNGVVVLRVSGSGLDEAVKCLVKQ